MKHTLATAVIATAILGVASAAHADLTTSGAVGLPLNPTAQIPAQGGVRIQGNYYDQGTFAGSDIKNWGLVAAGRIGDNIEINGGYTKLDTSPSIPGLDKSGFAFGAKYLFTRESDPAKVRIAAGGGYDRALYKNTYGYVVATKSFSGISADKAPITGHLGLRYDRFKGAVKSTKVSAYAGAEVPVTADGAFAIVGEIQSKNNEFTSEKFPYSASVRYRPTGKPFGVSVGIQRQGVTGDNGIFAQIGYTFGGSTAPDAQ